MIRWGGLAVVVSALPLMPPAAAAVPGTFDLTTTAVGVRVTSTQAPAASVVSEGLVDATEAFSTSALSSYGTAESAAARVYPGDLVAGGPALLCASFGPCPVEPPAYPLIADAAYPTAPVATAPGASAHASSRETGSSASGADGTTGPVQVRSAVASTRAWVDRAGAHVRSRSVVSGIVIGPLRVASLLAVDDVDVPADGPVVDEPRVTVTGVSLAGQAATIDDSGVHLLGRGTGSPVPALVQQGLEVRLLGASRQDRAGAVRSAAGGLLVAVTVPVSGVPQVVPGVPSLNRRYVGSVLLGGAGAVVAAGAAVGLDVTPPVARPGSPEAQLTPPYSAPPPPTGLGGAVTPPAGPVPSLVGSTRRLPGVQLFPLASLRSVALALMVLPLLALLIWRALLARRWRLS